MTKATTARREDANGYWEIDDNPISKAGVFPYLGAQLPGAPDPMKAYAVLRPPEELGAPECVDSFKLQPWIIKHAMLGPEEKGLTPPEEKGVHGVIGEKVRFSPETNTLYGNIKGFSEELKVQIEDGIKELSCGYWHDLDWTPGTWNGEPYDAVQRTIRANHLALVPSGRMGSDVAVMDGFQGYDPNFFTLRKDTSMTLEELAEQVKQLMQKLDGAEAAKSAAGDEAGAVGEEKKDAVAADNAGAAGEEKKDAVATDDTGSVGEEKKDAAAADDDGGALTLEKLAESVKTAIERIDRLGGTAVAADNDGATATKDDDAGAEKAKGMDSAETLQRRILRDMAGREKLVQALIPHVGSFDHSIMTATDVARYGCKKLGLSAPVGQEGAVLSGYLSGAQKATATFAMDGHSVMPPKRGKVLETYLKGGN